MLNVANKSVQPCLGIKKAATTKNEKERERLTGTACSLFFLQRPRPADNAKITEKKVGFHLGKVPRMVSEKGEREREDLFQEAANVSVLFIVFCV